MNINELKQNQTAQYGAAYAHSAVEEQERGDAFSLPASLTSWSGSHGLMSRLARAKGPWAACNRFPTPRSPGGKEGKRGRTAHLSIGGKRL